MRWNYLWKYDNNQVPVSTRIVALNRPVVASLKTHKRLCSKSLTVLNMVQNSYRIHFGKGSSQLIGFCIKCSIPKLLFSIRN